MINSRSIVVLSALIVFALALFAPRAWATPAQNPARQTVPTRVRTPPTLPPQPTPPPEPTTPPPQPTLPPQPTPPPPPTMQQPTLAPQPTAPRVEQPTGVSAPTVSAPTIAAPTPLGATPLASPPARVTDTPTRPRADATLTATTAPRVETPAPTVTLAASNEAASGGGVSPLLCGGMVLVFLGVGVLLLGKRRER